MFLEIIIFALIIGKVRGGKFKNLYFMEIRAGYLFIFGLLLQSLPHIFQRFNLTSLSNLSSDHFIYVHLLSYIMIVTCLILNITTNKAIKSILVGTLLNFAVIFTNGGYMPVSLRALMFAGMKDAENLGSQLDYKHIVLNEGTRLKFLADIIPTPEFYPLHKILSVGDIFLAAGVFMLINKQMTATIPASPPAAEADQG